MAAAMACSLPCPLPFHPMLRLGILRPSNKYPLTKFNRSISSLLSVWNFMQISSLSSSPSSPSKSNSSSTAELLGIPTVPTSAYVHLPFCRKRCFYCDFPIVALGTGNSSANPQNSQHDPRMVNYTDLICKEITATHSLHSKVPLDTVFFGGGTPSLLPAPLMSVIIKCLKTQFGLSPTAEISMEMDPGTFNADSLAEFMDLGINRVSLGVQAFQEDLLRSCGRAHGLKEVYQAIETIHSSGLRNWSLDLISSLPRQTAVNWKHSLQEAINSRPAHVSVYDLQVEEGTKFGLWYKPGQSPLPSENNSAEFYRLASRLLREAGYEHYEISNYAKEGFQCRHNLVYWQNLPYYSFGLGSTSYVEGLRFSRPRKMKDYELFVEELIAARGMQKNNESIFKDSMDIAMDTVMLSLRLARGLDVRNFSRVFGQSLCLSVCRELQPFVGSGHLMILDGERRPLSSEVFEMFCSDREISPWEFSQKNLGKEDGELFHGDGRGVCDEQLLISNAGNRVAFIRLSDPEGFLLSNELISTAFTGISACG